MDPITDPLYGFNHGKKHHPQSDCTRWYTRNDKETDYQQKRFGKKPKPSTAHLRADWMDQSSLEEIAGRHPMKRGLATSPAMKHRQLAPCSFGISSSQLNERNAAFNSINSADRLSDALQAREGGGGSISKKLCPPTNLSLIMGESDGHTTSRSDFKRRTCSITRVSSKNSGKADGERQCSYLMTNASRPLVDRTRPGVFQKNDPPLHKVRPGTLRGGDDASQTTVGSTTGGDMGGNADWRKTSDGYMSTGLNARSRPQQMGSSWDAADAGMF